MQSAAMDEAANRGAKIFPILAVDWVARGLSLGRGVYSPAMRHTDLGEVTRITKKGGWGEIVYGSGIAKGSLEVVRTNVDVSDSAGELADMLATYNPLGSAARIDWAAPGLMESDWEPLFRGIVEDWERDGLCTRILLKTDDTALRTPVPLGTFKQAENGSASDGSIFGTHHPLVLGIYDLWQVTARGAVPCVNIRYDKDIGYWWMVSADRMAEITRLYLDGKPQGTAGWSVIPGVFGGAQMTVISFAEGYQPEKEVIVSVDCKGPDDLGDAAGSTLTGVPDQLRVLLEEFTYRTPPLALWRGDVSILDYDWWDAVSEFFALHKFESARRLGADQNTQTAAELLQSLLDTFPWLRIWWTELGKLAIGVIDPDDVDPDDAAHLDLKLHHLEKGVPYAAGDRREVYTHIRMPYLWSPAEQKYMSAYEAHDVAALPEKLELTIENPWSQGRLVAANDLNPAAPADPEIPS